MPESAPRFAGRTATITGASRGIGLALAGQLPVVDGGVPLAGGA